MPLEERKNLQRPLFSLFWGLHQAEHIQSLLGRTPCPQFLCEESQVSR